MWFEQLTGFREDEVDDVATQFVVDGEWVTSSANGRTMRHGHFDTPSLADLRAQTGESAAGPRRLRLSEAVGDVQRLHTDPSNAGALFQVASQFNTLEMISPSVTPDDGIDRYEHDRTQGPACAICCGAGTIYRNYLIPIDGHTGQSAGRQINCLNDLASALGIEIPMRNGYALPTDRQLRDINQMLSTATEPELDAARSQLRIGLHADTEVTHRDTGHRDTGHTVTQAFCSALPIAYASHPVASWEPFARLVLEAAYEATLAAAVVNAATTGNTNVYLTLLGGGAFGNPTSWILDAVQRALDLYAHTGLDLTIVSYGSANPALRHLLDQYGT